MKKIYALFMTLCLMLSATAAPLAGTVKGSYPLDTKVVTSTKKLSMGKMQKAPAATQGLQYDATEGELIRYYNESDVLNVDATYLSNGQLSIKMIASDYSDMLSLVLWVEDTVPGIVIPEGTYPITSEPAYGTAYASPGVQNGSVYPSFYGMLNANGQILTPLYFLESGNVVVEVVDGNVKISIDAANSNNVPMTIVYEVGGKSEKVEVKGPLKYDATEADGALDVTYGADATVELTNGNGYSILTVASADATNEVDLAFFYDAADPETVIPVGTYTIDDSYTSGTVLASSGVNNQGQVSLSFYANLDEEGYLVTPIYFLVDGTVEVTNVDGYLKVEVNATNSNDVPIHIVYDATPAPEYEVMELTMTNLSVDTYGEATGLWASDMDNGIEVMLFLDAEGNLMEESSIMVSWMDYPVTGTVTKVYDEELATDVYTAELYTTVDETNYKLIITMYYVPAEAIPVVVENAVIDDQTETSGFMYMTGEWTDAEGVVYPVSVEVPGFDATVAEAVYKNVTVTVGGWDEEDPWLGFVQGDATVTVVENVVTLTGVMSSWDGLNLDVTISGTLPEPVEPVEMVGVVKRAIQNGDAVIVLTHEADGTAHIYQVVDGVAVAEVSQEGVVAVDTENAGDLLAISDIALTENGKLVAVNKIVCQSDAGQVKEGYKRGELKAYIWNDLAGAPAVWFTSKMSSNWYNSIQGHTMAVKGTSTNATLVTTGITATGNKFRYSVYNVIDGVYTDPAVNNSEYYHYTKGSAQTTDNIGASYEINFSLLAENTWVLDGNLVDPFEITDPLTYNTEVTAGAPLNEDLGKKYNGASYVTVGEQVWMVAPFATPAGDLVAVEILDITNGLGATQYVDMLYLEESVAATAAATAIQVTEEALVVTLVADATIYTMELPLSDEPDFQMYEDAITNLVIDYDNMLLIGGPSDAFQVEVVLGLGDYDRNTDNFALLPESSISVLGSEATFIDGIASVDGIAQTALAVVHCMWNGMALEFHLTMSAATIEPTVVVVENAVVEVEKYLLWGDMYDYALKMTGVWNNEEDGLAYPVLVEVPVYYPEATEPSEIYSTVTVGGWGDNDPWLGFGEGTLTVTTVDNVVTATGIVENPMAGVAIDITISGSITNVPDGIENITVTVKPVKMIKNGQLIIEKDGVQYNVNGAVVK